MKLIELKDSDKQEYNNFVAAQESGSFLQSWEWGEWQKALGRQIFRYWIVEDIGNKTGSVQLIKMPLPFGKYYLYAPYGPVAAGGNYGLRITDLELLTKQFPEAIFIRIEPKSEISKSVNQQVSKSANIQPAKTLFVDLTKPEDQLLLEMHHKTRYNIKLAQKHGVEIKDEFDISIGHGLFFDEALKLVIETSKRQKFNTFPATYYKKMVDQFVLNNKKNSEQSSDLSDMALATAEAFAKKHALNNHGDVKLHIYKAIFQNQLLSAAIMIDFGKTRTYLFGGSSDLHKNVMAPYLMQWTAMSDAKSEGVELYDFWGIETSSGETPGFVRFKLGFGGFEKSYAGAYDIVQNSLFYKTYGILRSINKTIKKISPR